MGQWGVRVSYTWAVTRIRVCEGKSLLVQVMGEGALRSRALIFPQFLPEL